MSSLILFVGKRSSTPLYQREHGEEIKDKGGLFIIKLCLVFFLLAPKEHF